MINVKRLWRRWKAHLQDIDNVLDYPDVMFPPLPTGIDIRGQVEMDAYYEYLRKLIQCRAPFPLIDDCESAGYRPHSLEGMSDD